jgi:FAD-dependent urate hydroxylase
MKVIIIGAGIGGTSAGIALQPLGHDVVIYDQMRENKPWAQPCRCGRTASRC